MPEGDTIGKGKVIETTVDRVAAELPSCPAAASIRTQAQQEVEPRAG